MTQIKGETTWKLVFNVSGYCEKNLPFMNWLIINIPSCIKLHEVVFNAAYQFLRRAAPLPRVLHRNKQNSQIPLQRISFEYFDMQQSVHDEPVNSVMWKAIWGKVATTCDSGFTNCDSPYHSPPHPSKGHSIFVGTHDNLMWASLWCFLVLLRVFSSYINIFLICNVFFKISTCFRVGSPGSHNG